MTYLQPLLEQYGVDAYLCGHDHISEWLTHKGITYIVAGGGVWVWASMHMFLCVHISWPFPLRPVVTTLPLVTRRLLPHPPGTWQARGA